MLNLFSPVAIHGAPSTDCGLDLWCRGWTHPHLSKSRKCCSGPRFSLEEWPSNKLRMKDDEVLSIILGWLWDTLILGSQFYWSISPCLLNLGTGWSAWTPPPSCTAQSWHALQAALQHEHSQLVDRWSWHSKEPHWGMHGCCLQCGLIMADNLMRLNNCDNCDNLDFYLW